MLSLGHSASIKPQRNYFLFLICKMKVNHAHNSTCSKILRAVALLTSRVEGAHTASKPPSCEAVWPSAWRCLSSFPEMASLVLKAGLRAGQTTFEGLNFLACNVRSTAPRLLLRGNRRKAAQLDKNQRNVCRNTRPAGLCKHPRGLWAQMQRPGSAGRGAGDSSR